MEAVTIQEEKIEQAISLLNELDLDCWLTFVRETDELPDPAARLIVTHNVTWHTAFILTRQGERIAIVARYDDDLVKQSGLYPTVITYTGDWQPALLETLQRLQPKSIAINYSLGDVASDGLTYGMYLQLVQALANTSFAEHLVSAGPLISHLRTRKTASELGRMREAIKTTEALFEQVSEHLRIGTTEQEISDFLHSEMDRLRLGSAWAYASCPGVKIGPNTLFGHGIPGAIAAEPGQIVSIDFGVRQNEYCSDLQRLWYLRQPGEQAVPEVVRHAFEAVRGAVLAGKAALRPGVQGWQVDEAARSFLVQAGYPEYQHALGHSVGRHAHDGGPVLGPRWQRYGETPYYPIEEGSVYTLELGVMTERGYVSQEDEFLVTANGCEWFSHPQESIYLI